MKVTKSDETSIVPTVAESARIGVFGVTTTGTVKVLHGFGGGSDEAYPQAGLTHIKGSPYGPTEVGGAGCRGSYGCGTVFRVDSITSGTKRSNAIDAFAHRGCYEAPE